ncbi:hypothetical protein DPMN_031900 [Dreissena polymorpha]|uniref:Uncharacterized protein n=1 Tax=Dreissena polymorpha TaxID=45954 RepID=A0A9D4M1V9_DREPO|nr:hypothetical protein DPMN_031900 [Dreissena polymorpha]
MPWITTEIKKLMRSRDQHYKKMKKSKDPTHIAKYKEYQQLLQKKLRQSQWASIDNIVFPEKSDTGNRSTSKRL